jgi:hypothetical protein
VPNAEKVRDLIIKQSQDCKAKHPPENQDLWRKIYDLCPPKADPPKADKVRPGGKLKEYKIKLNSK